MRNPEKPMEKKVRLSIERYGREIEKSHDLKLLLVGSVTNTHSEYCMFFTSDKEITLKQGQELAVSIVKDFLQMLLQNPVVKRYANWAKTYYISPTSTYSPTLDTVGLKIAFWDHNTNRPKAPFLAEIMFENRTFYYYEADPKTQALRLVHTESYADADRGVETE